MRGIAIILAFIIGGIISYPMIGIVAKLFEITNIGLGKKILMYILIFFPVSSTLGLVGTIIPIITEIITDKYKAYLKWREDRMHRVENMRF